jgi:type I restriction enzyme S subunit
MRCRFGDVLEEVERPVQLDGETQYQLVIAKRNRGGIVSRGTLCGREILTKSQFAVEKGDFLISRRQIIHGACGIVPRELSGAVVSNEYAALRPRDQLAVEYLGYLSHTPYFQRTCFQSSVGVDVEKMIFKLEDWLKYGTPIPPPGEQCEIVDILSSVDNAIEKTQAVIDQLQVVKAGLMQELLTRGLSGRHTRFHMTELGELPEEWEVFTIGDLLESSTYGVNCPLTTDTAGTPVLRMGNIQNDRLDLSDLKFADLSQEDADKVMLRPGDVLFNRTNSADLVGKVAIVTEDTPLPLSYASYLLRLRVNLQRCRPEWLHLRMASEETQRGLRSIATKGVSQANINPTKMRSIKVAVPSISEQVEQTAAVSSTEAACSSETRGLNALGVLKAALLSVLLTGEVRVTPDEEHAA